MAKQYRVKCHETDAQCNGIVKFNNSVFSVPGLVDGETAQIELVYGKDRQSTLARLASIETASPKRCKPFCSEFNRCGGCQLQYVDYETQLALKQAAAHRLLSGFAPVSPILGMTPSKSGDTPQKLHYRHKIHASFYRSRRGMELGIYEENTHKVVSVPDCAIQNRDANAILLTLRSLANEFHLTAYNEDTRQGLLRHVLLRCGYASGQIMVVLVLGNSTFPGRKHFLEKLLAAHPEITTIVQNINNQKTSMVLGNQETVLYGKGYIEDSLCGLTFRISPKSFYQVNPQQTELLYRTAIDFAALTCKETVLDAYCGTGTIGLIAAAKAGQVIGVESNAAAVHDATANAAANHITNAEFIRADATEYMRSLVKAGKGAGTFTPQVVFLDPPRSGATPEFLSALQSLHPDRIVYVSCNMETLARDLKLLVKSDYRVTRIQPVDLFPWTNHVETVVCLSQQKPDDHIEIEINLDEIDTTSAETKATYKEIRKWVLEKYGFHVTNLNIAQVKQKHGIIEWENYNKAKSTDSKQPGCPEEKVKAIEDAMRHFQMIEEKTDDNRRN